MAKTTFAKLALKTNTDIASFETNGQIVEVKQYLPLNEKMTLISTVINNSGDDNGFYNIGKVEMNLILEIVFAYTNITFTETQKKDPQKLYDVIYSSGLWEDIYNCMKPAELQWVRTTVYTMIDKIYEYRNSVYGILDAMKNDYDTLNLDAETIRDNLADPENMTLLKDVLAKLG